MPSFKKAVKTMLKQVAFATPLHHRLLNPYTFMFTPSELIYLTECITEAAKVPGCFIEAGCAYGATTVWLNNFMTDQKIERHYYAIDTFAGFKPAHVQYEADERRKSRPVQEMLKSSFTDNKQSWFDKTIAAHHISRVTSIQADVGAYAFWHLAPIAFCLLDVDLYVPIREALPQIYDSMTPGGILVVDDCWKIEQWDGALQAYEEFVRLHNLPREIVCRKLGVIRR